MDLGPHSRLYGINGQSSKVCHQRKGVGLAIVASLCLEPKLVINSRTILIGMEESLGSAVLLCRTNSYALLDIPLLCFQPDVGAEEVLASGRVRQGLGVLVELLEHALWKPLRYLLSDHPDRDCGPPLSQRILLVADRLFHHIQGEFCGLECLHPLIIIWVVAPIFGHRHVQQISSLSSTHNFDKRKYYTQASLRDGL